MFRLEKLSTRYKVSDMLRNNFVVDAPSKFNKENGLTAGQEKSQFDWKYISIAAIQSIPCSAGWAILWYVSRIETMWSLSYSGMIFLGIDSNLDTPVEN